MEQRGLQRSWCFVLVQRTRRHLDITNNGQASEGESEKEVGVVRHACELSLGQHGSERVAPHFVCRTGI